MTKGTSLSQNITLITIILAAVLVWFLGAPAGVADRPWHLLIIFMATITGIIANPLPMGAVAILGVLACVLTGTLSLKDCLSGFGADIVWLLVFAFFISIGFIRTGLGSRIAYYFISKLGRTTIGLSYGLVFADLILSPLIPSVTARGGGIIFPIANALCKSYSDETHPGVSTRNGGFLMQVCVQANVITSALFLTAMAANPLVVELASAHKIQITWASWAKAALVPGLVNLLIIPMVIYFLYPPAIKHSESAPELARQKLRDIGPMKWQEYIMLFTFVILIVLWIFGEKGLGVSSTTTAMIGFAILLVTRVITFDDAVSDKGAWHTFIWYAILVMMSKYLSELGMMGWLGHRLEEAFIGFKPIMTVAILGLFYYYVHYFFASITAHITVLFPTFLVVFINAGIPPMLAALALGFMSIISGGITHFSIGSAPIFYGAGYMKTKTWWYIGAVVSFVNLIIWSLVGSVWWKAIGLW